MIKRIKLLFYRNFIFSNLIVYLILNLLFLFSYIPFFFPDTIERIGRILNVFHFFFQSENTEEHKNLYDQQILCTAYDSFLLFANYYCKIAIKPLYLEFGIKYLILFIACFSINSLINYCLAFKEKKFFTNIFSLSIIFPSFILSTFIFDEGILTYISMFFLGFSLFIPKLLINLIPIFFSDIESIIPFLLFYLIFIGYKKNFISGLFISIFIVYIFSFDRSIFQDIPIERINREFQSAFHNIDFINIFSLNFFKYLIFFIIDIFGNLVNDFLFSTLLMLFLLIHKFTKNIRYSKKIFNDYIFISVLSFIIVWVFIFPTHLDMRFVIFLVPIIVYLLKLYVANFRYLVKLFYLTNLLILIELSYRVNYF